MTEKVKPLALSLSAAIVSAIFMLILDIVGNLGFYLGYRRYDEANASFLLIKLDRNYLRNDRSCNYLIIMAYLFGFFYNGFI